MTCIRPGAVVALLCFVLVGLGAAPGARAWWNDDWAFRKDITLDLSKSGADIPGSPADVPVLIRLSLGNFGYFGDTAPDGGDLRFVAGDDKTPLRHRIERYDPQAQLAFIWVEVPRLTGGVNTDKIFLYYGNKSGKAGTPSGIYDTHMALVYHFGPPATSPQDATDYKTEPAAFSAEVTPASLINAGVRFSGSQVISVKPSSAVRLVPANGFTLSTWVRTAGPQQRAYVAALEDGGKSLILGLDGTRAFAQIDGGTGPVSVDAEFATGDWHHLAVRAAAGTLTLLIDGVEAANAKATLPEIGGTLTIGGSAQGGHNFSGELDELQVSNVGRSTDWLRAAAVSQGIVAPLVVYGGDMQKDSGASESYFSSTLRNVTVDGWVVIGILAVMFVASLLIMLSKMLFLNRVARGNALFLAQFHKLKEDPAALEKRLGQQPGAAADRSVFESDGASEEFGGSTIYPLYHHGILEVMRRLEGQAAGADRVRSLSAQSIEAIRATLDASLVRMTQKLSARMVWLTISIAGGPFLGLLGTVVGVMITFAAIAASGEVNINAIAPGTAAALVATVAGLGVAIPCLFGYNYLNTRVREITADMRVFVDEFVTRIAETYS
ncbi:MAG TPA: DUF2341 domain-containing protein [Steroidobacteraceae bacterium]|nr:DUF2341 domain-containing protein [Steroidobacteraceae bacterium]